MIIECCCSLYFKDMVLTEDDVFALQQICKTSSPALDRSPLISSS